MKKAGKKVLIIILIILVIGLAVVVYWQFKHPAEKIFTVEKEIELTGDTIKWGLKDIGKLVTQEYYFTHVEKFESDRTYKDIALPLTNTSFVYSFDGTITAGIDFEKVEVEKDDDKKTVTVKLPEVEIMSAEVDPESRVIYEEKNNILNPIDLESVLVSFEDMIKDEKEKAVERGVLDKAADNAKILVENFLKSTFTLEEYKISVVFAE